MPSKDKDSKDKSKDIKEKKKSDKSIDQKDKENKKDNGDKSVDIKKSKKKEGERKSVKIDDAPPRIEEIPKLEDEQHEPEMKFIDIPLVKPMQYKLIDTSYSCYIFIYGLKQRLCLRHKYPLKYFCETSEEPVCEQCTIQGPHNTQLHRISNLQDSFNRRAGKLTFSIENNLREKVNLLGAQLHRVEYRIEEIKDTRVEYSGILERLKNAEGVKHSILHHDIEVIQRDLSQINEIGHTFFELIKDPQNPIPFLRQARNIWESCQYLKNKPFKNEITVYPQDLPRELQQIRQSLSQGQANQVLIQQKDEIIWKLLLEQSNVDTFQGAQQFEEEIHKEVETWATQQNSFIFN